MQVVLIALLGVAAVLGPEWPDAVERILLGLGVALGLAGAALFVPGLVGLGAQLTPFPKPVEGGSLRERGVYGVVRHPIYGGGLVLALAWSLATSWLGLVPTALLAILFEVKSRREEQWLVEHHAEYDGYRRRVRRRFIPFLW